MKCINANMKNYITLAEKVLSGIYISGIKVNAKVDYSIIVAIIAAIL